MDIELKLYTEEEVSIVMRALSYFMYDRPHTTQKQWDIANSVLERMDSLI